MKSCCVLLAAYIVDARSHKHQMWWVVPDVSEVCSAFIFRVGQSTQTEFGLIDPWRWRHYNHSKCWGYWPNDTVPYRRRLNPPQYRCENLWSDDVLMYNYQWHQERQLHPVTYRSFATRVSQLKIRLFWVIGIERNVCRCTFNRYSVITQFVELTAGEQLCRRRSHRKL